MMGSPVVRIFVRSAMVVTVAMALTGCIPVSISTPPVDTPPPTTPAAVPISETSPPTDTVTETATATAPSNWEETNAFAADGVVKIATTDCTDGHWTGSGFLISPNLIVTAAHVVADQATIDLALTGATGPQSATAQVLGIDSELDLALLRSSVAFDGHVFTLAQQNAKIGQEVAALGFPLGYGYKMTKGSITGFGEQGSSIASLEKNKIQTDADINGGNSGGPLVYLDGVVAGIVVATLNEAYVGHKVDGFGYALDATIAAPQIEVWKNAGKIAPSVSCSTPTATATSATSLPIDVQSTDPSAQDIAMVLLGHALAINQQDYAAAFADFTDSEQLKMGGLEMWSAGLRTSAWTSITVKTVEGFDSVTTVGVSFRTYQDAAYGYDGQTCSDFNVNYTFIQQDGRWLIAEAEAARGYETPSAC